MTRQTLQRPVKTCLALLALLVVSTSLVGSFPEPPPEEKKDKTAPKAEKNADDQVHREAEQMVRAIDLEILSEDKWTKVERIEKSLLFYGDPTRNNDRGSVWGWGRKGRPVALLELFQGMDNRTSWAVAICNTSGGNCGRVGRVLPGGARMIRRPNSRTSPAPRPPQPKLL
jgi:hypothetical protein